MVGAYGVAMKEEVGGGAGEQIPLIENPRRSETLEKGHD